MTNESVAACDIPRFPGCPLHAPLSDRMRWAVSMAWSALGCRVAGGAVEVFKEASVQLHYAQMLQGILPLIQYKATERLWLDLEKTVVIPGDGIREIDVAFHGTDGDLKHTIAIEMKVYREWTANETRRGAQDIFRKDVYVDLATLEQYIARGHADRGVALVLTDYETLVRPRPYPPDEKWWNYDIAEGIVCKGPVVKDSPVGGKAVSIPLNRCYLFHWEHIRGYWLADIEGT